MSSGHVKPNQRRAGNSKLIGMVLATVFFLVFPLRLVWAASDSPCLNHGERWRIAYCEGGPWADYRDTLLSIIEALMDKGWIDAAPLPAFESPTDTSEIWTWLCTQAQSRYLTFSKEGYYSADWKDEFRDKNRKRMLSDLAQRRYDLVWALGTWAGLDLVNDLHEVPTMVMSTSNPVTAGIISDPEDSGLDHVFVRTDPTRVLRQVLLFHAIIDFSRLGVVYEDSDYGRAYAYLDEVKKAALQGGFELVTCKAHNDEGTDSTKQAMKEYLDCVLQLAPVVDAFIYDDHTGGRPSEVGLSLPVFVQHKVPTWSTRGSELVQRGVLMSIAKKDFSRLGEYYAETMARILNGARPRDMEQVFRSRFRLAINLKTAELLGYDPPVNLLHVTDDVFSTIEPPWEDGAYVN